MFSARGNPRQGSPGGRAGEPLRSRLMGCGLVLLWLVAVALAAALANVAGVGPLLAFVVLALAAWIHWMIVKAVRRSPSGPAPAETAPAVERAPSAPRESAPEHRASSPTGVPVEAWGPVNGPLEVVGEAYRPEAFHRLFRGLPLRSPDGAELSLPAALVPDPTNPYDHSAVAVWVGGQHLGYMDRTTAKRWHRPLRALMDRGEHLVVPCRVWAADRGGRIAARVTVYLPAVDGLDPSNGLPAEPFEVLPVGPAMQVTGEDQHMDVLTGYAAGTERPVAVTLHAIHEMRARSAFEAVEVRLDGERVGVLSKVQSENMLPLVKHVEARAKVAVARAVVRGNKLKADVVLFVAKAQDVEPSWIEALGPPAPRSAEYHERRDDEWQD